MQSGLPVIVTSTSGQLEIFNKASPGFLIDDYDEPRLEKKLKNWLEDTRELTIARDLSCQLAHEYTRDSEYQKLIQLINREK
jgi:glycosyltransferase involved in cell wall biosynthesis